MGPADFETLPLFEKTFGTGGEISIVRAPGRVNLIGEHTDYNDGFVFPLAIEPDVRLTCRKREDSRVRLASTLYPGQIVEFSLNEPIMPGEPKWANYCKGIAAELVAANVPLVGMDALISNTLPPGGGLSSSAALEVGTGYAMLHLAGVPVDRPALARMAQQAEHHFAGVPVGIMDQMIIASGRAGHAMLLDCRDLSTKFFPLNGDDVKVVVINSMVRHELTGGEYAERRRQCEAGVAYFRKTDPGVRALRDVTLDQVMAAQKDLGDVVFRRCRHVVTENARTVLTAEKLAMGDYPAAGRLMVESHNSLRDDYEVSVPEIDFLVEQAMKSPGVFGARITGGGFGGSVVALARPDAVQPLLKTLEERYFQKFRVNPMIFVTRATAGVGVIDKLL